MSATSYPIPPDVFAATIETLDLAQLHTESSRLQNSIYHLERSNITLEELKDEDTDCREALSENEEVIRQQKARIAMVEDEVKRRGFRMGHASEEDVVREANVTGRASLISNSYSTATNGEATAGGNTTTTNGQNGNVDEEEQGVYL